MRGAKIVEVRRSLPGDSSDEQSRYLEAAVGGIIVCCLYLPNGNPQPGPKFDYKLQWFERLIEHAATLYASTHPVIMAGDFNVVPTDFDIYDPRSWRKTRSCSPRLARAGNVYWSKVGSTRFEVYIRMSQSTHSGTIFANIGSETPACASITCF